MSEQPGGPAAWYAQGMGGLVGFILVSNLL